MTRQTPLKGVALCCFTAVVMPARRQPPARVGRRLGIQREGGVGGCLELPPQKRRQFVLVAEGKRAGQLVAMPS